LADFSAGLLGNPTDAENSASGVNRARTVVGYFVPEGHSRQSIQSPGDRRAAIWKDGRQSALRNLRPEVAPKWGTNPQPLSDCNAINDTGVAAGWVLAPDGRKACLWKDGRVEVLSTLDGYDSEARSIKKDDTVVGGIREQGNKGGRGPLAFLWRNGKGIVLNSQIPADSGWTLYTAAHISDSGFIVGYGKYSKRPSDFEHVFLLTPEPK
jgi:uncharacterized membrane protein